MFTRYFKYIFTCIALATISILTSCQDEIEFVKPDFGDGDVNVSAELMFKPLAVTDVTTSSRSAAPEGGQFKTVNSLYILFFDTEKNRIDSYSGAVNYELTNVNRPSDTNEGQTTAESSTPRAKFNKVVRSGQYYIYAVANVDSKILDDVTTVDELRSLSLTWDGDDMNNNLAMFGVFKNTSANTGTVDNTGFEEDVLVTLSSRQTNIHSWLRRATSKVTVAFDGSGLLDDVEIFIRSARLVDVAASTMLGRSLASEEITNAATSFVIDYGAGDVTNWPKWPSVTNQRNYDSYNEGGNTIAMHSEFARALPCYENLQGTREGKPKLQDANGDGIIDNPDASVYSKDGVERGTYLEVEAYYVSKHKNYKTQGEIKYRFMLGMNELNDFNVVRNHHYKVTLAFKGFGNEVDWHIEYSQSNFSVTPLKDVNYQGMFFVPDQEYAEYNLNHNFSNQNTITVTSFTGADDVATFDEVELWYKEAGAATFSKTPPSWLVLEKEGEVRENRYRDYTFVTKSDYTEIDIDQRLKKDTSKGSASSFYNLSNSTGAMTIEETANCYIVDGPGYYIFPLVYGNAYSSKFKDGDNKAAYSNSAGPLQNFESHLQWGPIITPFIQENSSWCKPATVELLWQDEKNLISKINYEKGAFVVNGKAMGGISFQITKANITQGNALIAVKDPSGNVMWSWHIWVTDLDFDKDVTVSNNMGVYDIMNFNLGWCAEKVNNVRKKVRYYPERSCEIKIVNSKHAEETIKIVRHPHTVMPRGDNPAYQWGRKDPFPGRTTGNANKVLYNINGGIVRDASTDPERLFEDNKVGQQYEDARKTTTEILYLMIQQPLKWHNPKRTAVTGASGQFSSNNKSYSNLWSVGDGKMRGVQYKTVYDPCPPGYQVCHSNVFNMFTTSGNASYDPRYWLDVAEKNMVQDYYGGVDQLSSHVMEFYTDKTRLESLTIPLNGYRDWDARAEVYEYGKKGYIWTNTCFRDASKPGVTWQELEFEGNNNSTYLEVSRFYQSNWTWETQSSDFNKLRVVRPANGFYNCDGCPVRPMAY